MRTLAHIFGFFLIASCGPRPDAASRVSGRIDDEQAAEALRVVAEVERYAPFTYEWDGCGARAYYLSAELALKSIPSSAVFVFPAAGPDAPKLELENGVKWRFHVAPMIMPAATGDAQVVLDPAMLSGPSLPIDKWISKMTSRHPESPARTGTVPGSTYETAVLDTPDEYLGRHDVIDSFADLPAFSSSAFGDACEVSYRNLGLDPDASSPTQPIGGPAVEARRRLLLERTQLFFGELPRLGKWNDDFPAGFFPSCMGRRFAVRGPATSDEAFEREASGWAEHFDAKNAFEAAFGIYSACTLDVPADCLMGLAAVSDFATSAGISAEKYDNVAISDHFSNPAGPVTFVDYRATPAELAAHFAVDL